MNVARLVVYLRHKIVAGLVASPGGAGAVSASGSPIGLLFLITEA